MVLFPARRLDDPRDLKVVAALEAVGAGRSTVQLPTMAPAFRDDLRAQLVAVTPRLVEEGVRPDTETAPRRATASGRAAARRGAVREEAPARRPIRTRPMTVLVAGAAIVVLGLGGATWLARNALPGDALYGLKRTAEGVDVSFSGSDLDKGHQLLLDATTRVQEVDSLISRPQSMSLGTGSSASGALSDSTVRLIVSTLQAADTDTHKGMTKIGDDAIATGKPGGLQLVAELWAPAQQASIDDLVARIPSGPAHDQATTSAREIRAGLQRAQQLLTDYSDKTCQRGRDAFGPTPCQAGASGPATPGRPSSGPTSGPSGSSSTGGGSTAPTTGPAPTGGGAPTSSAPSSAAPPTPGRTTKPAAATSSPNAPVGIDSCGVQVSLPVVDVSLGTCTPGG